MEEIPPEVVKENLNVFAALLVKDINNMHQKGRTRLTKPRLLKTVTDMANQTTDQ